jgi:hypothetical protein
LVRLAHHRAKSKGLPCTVDPKEVQAIIDAGECQMTGIPFNLDGGRTWDSPSLDRIDNAKGYTPENVRVVLYCINVMANTWGENKIVEISEAIMQRRRSRSAELQAKLESALKRRLSSANSPEYALTWKEWPMLSGPPICALRASGHRTSDSGFIGWPTPMAGTPAQRGYNEAGNTDSSRKTVKILKGWATPRANRYAGADSHGNRQLPLNATMVSAVLDPEHWRWLMGFPPEWASCAPTATRSSRKSRQSSSGRTLKRAA